MPPLPRIHTPALARLADELRFAPRPALLRDIERAEALAGDLDPDLQYPIEWIVFRITGYRPDQAPDALVPAPALLGDLSALVERLCHAARLTDADTPQPPEHADALARRWNVSRKTLERWRRRGLVGRRVRTAEGQPTLRFTRAATEAFAARHPDLLGTAADFTRIDAATEARIVRRARRYADLLGCSLNQAAERLAPRFDRSRETVRQLLRRHDARAARAGEPTIFSDPAPLTARDRRAIERAWRRAVEPARLVKRYRRSRAAIHRVVNEERLARLASLDLGHAAPEAAALDEHALRETLAAPSAASLPEPPAPADLLDLVELMSRRVAPDARAERERARADHALRARAARCIAEADPTTPQAALIDRAETDLRWSARLRAALAAEHLALALESLEAALGERVRHTRAADALAAVSLALAALGQGLDAFDPWKRGRLAATVGLTVARRASGAAHAERDARRAQVMLARGTPAPDLARLVSPWAAPLAPDPRIPRAIESLEPDLRRILSLRWGLAGETPHTLAEAAAILATTPMHAARLERRATRAALAGRPA